MPIPTYPTFEIEYSVGLKTGTLVINITRIIFHDDTQDAHP